VENDWEDWAALRERILQAKQIQIEYSFGECADVAEDLIGEGMAKALDDLLEGGRLADCVKICSQSEMRFAFDNGNGLEGHYLRCLWMNGMHNGEYVCGEVPFEENEQKVRHCGGWRQANFFDEEDSGLKISLHPDTSPALMQRLRRTLREFEGKINCYVDNKLTLKECLGDCYDKITETNKAVDDAEQLAAPDLRKYFTKEEIQKILNQYPVTSALYVKHAEPSCSEDQLEKVRFAWALVLILQHEIGAKHIFGEAEPLTEVAQLLDKLPEEVIDELRDYRFNHSGLGDLSIAEDQASLIYQMDGACVRIRNAYLNGIEDVRTMCDFLNEVNEIVAEARAENSAIADKDFNPAVGSLSLFNDGPLERERADGPFGSELEKLDWMPKRTLREHYEYLRSLNRYTCELNCLDFDGMMFESDDSDNWARLRFRFENGRYIYEIAQSDME